MTTMRPTPNHPARDRFHPRQIARKALTQWDNLGCVLGRHEGRYIYEDGARCILGIMLEPGEVAVVAQNEELNTTQIGGLLEALGLIEEYGKYLAALTQLQEYHDGVCTAAFYSLSTYRTVLAEFRQYLEQIALQSEGGPDVPALPPVRLPH